MYLKRVYSITLLLLLVHGLGLTQVKVERSSKTTTIENQEYYLHKVLAKQTLYSISRVYEVKVDKIKEVNNCDAGINVGSTLLIPVVKKEEKDYDKFIYHFIEQGETVYSISKKYGVTTKSIISQNSISLNDLPIGLEIRIPKPQKVEIVDQISSEECKLHTVKPKETWYFLSREYKISVDELKALNPDTDILKIGQKVKIPNTDSKPEPETPEVASASNEVSVNNSDEVASVAPMTTNSAAAKYFYHTMKDGESLNSIAGFYGTKTWKIKSSNPRLSDTDYVKDRIVRIKMADIAYIEYVDETMKLKPEGYDLSVANKSKTHFTIALMMPFEIPLNKNINASTDKELKLDKRSVKFFQFYEGILTALRRIKKSGVSIDLLVYDTERDSAKVEEILKNKELAMADLIIGPVFTKHLNIVAKYAKENNIYMVNPLLPLDNYDLIIENPYIFQAVPFKSSQELFVADYLAQYHNEDNVVVIYTEDEKSMNKKLDSVKERMFYVRRHEAEDSLRFFEFNFDKDGLHGLRRVLSKNNQNIVIVPTEKSTKMTTILSNLAIYKKDYDITLYTYSPRQEKLLDKIELGDKTKVDARIFSTKYIDYYDEDNIEFMKSYRETWKQYPTVYSYQGYDIINYFISLFSKYGVKQYTEKELNSIIVNTLQSDFEFKKLNDFSGYENRKVFVLRYDKDFNLVDENDYYEEEEPLEELDDENIETDDM